MNPTTASSDFDKLWASLFSPVPAEEAGRLKEAIRSFNGEHWSVAECGPCTAAGGWVLAAALAYPAGMGVRQAETLCRALAGRGELLSKTIAHPLYGERTFYRIA